MNINPNSKLGKVIKFFTITLKGFNTHRGALHAAGLTYYSMLALVPILCLALLLAKTCGVGDFARNQINQRIDAMIANVENAQDDEELKLLTQNESEEKKAQKREAAQEFGKQARAISNQLFDRIDAFNVDTLGWVGLIMLLWTVISTLGVVEQSMNEIRNIPKPRPIWRKAIFYPIAVLVLPLLATLAMSMPLAREVMKILNTTLGAASYTKWVSDALVALISSRLFSFSVAFFFSSLTFTLFFYFLPNGKVNFRAAFRGGTITALAFGVWLKICAIAQVGIANSSALYGSFAFLPIVLTWIYMSWQIIILGANMVYAFEEIK